MSRSDLSRWTLLRVLGLAADELRYAFTALEAEGDLLQQQFELGEPA